MQRAQAAATIEGVVAASVTVKEGLATNVAHQSLTWCGQDSRIDCEAAEPLSVSRSVSRHLRPTSTGSATVAPAETPR
jgi:hypothetical protein